MNMKVDLCGVTLNNPVMTASGTFGSGAEYAEFVDLNKLGAVVTKGVANVPWPGNPTPRVAEVYGGMLNAVGLQNPGIDLFVERDIPFLKQFDTKIMVNVCGHSTEEYIEVVERLRDQPVDLLEINISCPNVKEGGIAFGQDPKAVEAITKEMKKHAAQPVIMKLSPNVTDITEMARAAEAGGADGLSLINTITGMKIDINRQKFVLAIRQAACQVGPLPGRCPHGLLRLPGSQMPIVGMGGIMNAEDAALKCSLREPRSISRYRQIYKSACDREIVARNQRLSGALSGCRYQRSGWAQCMNKRNKCQEQNNGSQEIQDRRK